MPNRILKESICVSESIDALMPAEEIAFYRLLVNCDDFGRMDGRAAVLRAKLFPLKQFPLEQLKSALDRLEALQMIRRYQVKGKPYLYVVNWDAHQTIRAKRSKYPPPECCPDAAACASPVPETGDKRHAAEETVPPAAKSMAKPDIPAPKPDTETAKPESAGMDKDEGSENAAGEPHTPLNPKAKPKPSAAQKRKATPIKKAPLHKKQKGITAPVGFGRAAVKERSKAPPGNHTAMAAAPSENICAPPEALSGPSPPLRDSTSNASAHSPPFASNCMHVQASPAGVGGDAHIDPESACTHMNASASNCKHMQADEINCKHMHADASRCSRNPIRIQSESQSQSVSVSGSQGLAAAADAASLREGLDAIEKRAVALGMAFASADRDLAKSLMAEFTLDWLLEAMRRAGEGQASCRSWRYIRAILSAWRAKGGIDSVHGGSHSGGEGQGLREAQSDVRAALLIRRY